MNQSISFNEILEDVEKLSLEEKETLLDILNHRIIDQRRNELLKDIQEANRELKSGNAQPRRPDELMNEIMQ